MAKFKRSAKKEKKTFEIANLFVDQYLKNANPTYVCVYIYGLRLCSGKCENSSFAHIAKELSLLESDVVKAFAYWEQQGIVSISEEDGEQVLEFKDLTTLPINTDEKRQEQPSEKKPAGPPIYHPKEIALYAQKDDKVKQLFSFAEQTLNKPLTPNEMGILYSFYDFYQLPFEVVFMLLEYCVSIHKKSVQYMEKVAQTWAQEGVNTLAAAENYIAKREQNSARTAKYKKSFGIFDRALSKSEENYLKSWTDELNMSDELIREAYDITVLKTGKLSFPYMNTILKSWHEKGFKTVEQIRQEKPKGANGNKFVNFKPQALDYDELDRYVRDKKINGK